jgi:hypothetical protein
MMSRHRPPFGGLFRLKAPAAPAPAERQARGEAREAIRSFVRAIERLERDADAARSAPSQGRAER